MKGELRPLNLNLNNELSPQRGFLHHWPSNPMMMVSKRLKAKDYRTVSTGFNVLSSKPGLITLAIAHSYAVTQRIFIIQIGFETPTPTHDRTQKNDIDTYLYVHFIVSNPITTHSVSIQHQRRFLRMVTTLVLCVQLYCLRTVGPSKTNRIYVETRLVKALLITND